MVKSSRRMTPDTLLESFELVGAAAANIRVLVAWHPSVLPLQIAHQQIAQAAAALRSAGDALEAAAARAAADKAASERGSADQE